MNSRQAAPGAATPGGGSNFSKGQQSQNSRFDKPRRVNDVYEIDWDEARRFLELLDEPDARFTFQVAAETGDPSVRAAVYHGPLEQEAGRRP